MSADVKPGYKMSEVGAIPEDWVVVEASNIGQIRTGPFGTLLKASEYSSTNGVPLISVGEIGPGKIKITLNTPQIPLSVIKRLPMYVLKRGDIVFGRKGAVDRSAIVNENEEGWFLGSDGISIRPNSKCYPPYIGWQFQHHKVQSWLRQNAIGTTMPSLNQSVLRKVLIPLASLAEQQAIAEALSDTDALIESLEQLITKKRQIKQGAMQELLTGKRRLPGFSGEWEVKTLGDVVDRFIGGGTPSRSNSTFWGNEIPWATVKDFATFDPERTQEFITCQGLRNSASNLIPKYTLIISTRMAVGKAIIYNVDVAINQDLKGLLLKPNILTKYLFFWFQHKEQAFNDIGGGSTVKGVSIRELGGIEINLPPTVAEQTAIATILSDMDAEITALEQKLSKARQIKQGMMQELLTGRIRLV